MTRRHRRRFAVRLGASVVVALLLGTASAASVALPPGSGGGDLVASAQADAADPAALDEAVRTVWPQGPGARADAVSTASATCDGCHARSVTVQVVRADQGWRWWVDTDNVATAWATCRDCTAQAVAIQVVLVRRAGRLDVDNRAMAVTSTCTRCTVDAIAYQLVVAPDAFGGDRHGLQQRLLAWARTQPAAPSAPSGTSARSPGARTATGAAGLGTETLEATVLEQLPGTVLRSHVDHRRAH